MHRHASFDATPLEDFIRLIPFRTTSLTLISNSEFIVSSLAMRMIPHLLVSAALAVSAIASATDGTEYDYVIIGSGPGGGSLA